MKMQITHTLTDPCFYGKTQITKFVKIPIEYMLARNVSCTLVITNFSKIIIKNKIYYKSNFT